MRLKTFWTYVVVSTLLAVSCKDEPSESAPAATPQNLQVTVEVDTANRALVRVEATAENTNFFEIEFFHPGGSTVIESPNGKGSYEYQDTGTFDIKIRAHASFDIFIEETRQVTIDLGQNSGGGGSGGIPDKGYTTPLSYPNLTLVWNDEFEGNSLSSDWTQEVGVGNNGWGNNELQYYRPENTEVRDGYLIITAKNELFGSRSYTSSRIITKGKQAFKYGRIDIRAALPQGQGLWPAVWMLGHNIDTVGWPRCGEIDIMEMVGGTHTKDQGDAYVHGTIHWDNNGTKSDFGGFNKKSQGIFADEFHVFSIIWDDQAITWYRDDIQYHQVDITPAALSEFHQKQFFIFNVAVGGDWPGSPDASTQFPQQMAVDYVRVFQ